uniref:Uncharacterized protein n=1 Tax=Arundo donax TaxID=35708 RepID=A0A0A9B712_ARUDO
MCNIQPRHVQPHTSMIKRKTDNK